VLSFASVFVVIIQHNMDISNFSAVVADDAEVLQSHQLA